MPSALPKLRIFVSSPGDVGAERAVAVAVTERLQLEFRGQVELEAYLWERSVLRATDTFQAQIIDIREADLALFILWSRIGTPLPREQFARADGSQYMSGTEYEFERALLGHEETGRPELLCYLKTAEIRFSLRDRDERARRNAELDGVGAFVDRWFKNPDGTFKSAFYSFEKTALFEELVEIHLRDWVREQLRALHGTVQSRSIWQGSPFRGLQAFDFEHSLIYCGRTAMVAETLEVLRRRAGEGHPFLMVTGMSGVGKSSLVRAGLLPLLTRPSVIEGVIGWRRATFKPNVSHQGLIDSFAAAMLAPDALPDLATPAGAPALLTDPAALTGALIGALDAATLAARHARPDPETEGVVRLVVLVDQFEEVFDETVSVDDRHAFCECLRTLLLSQRVWVVATLRADFFSRMGDLPERFRDLFIERGGLFTVGGPRTAEIAQMIRRPAAMAGLEFERRGDPEEGLDDVLRDAAAGNPTVLPLLEFTLDELWRRSAGSGLLRFSDYEAIGGLHGALRLRADEELGKLPPPVQAALPDVLAAIVHTDPTDDLLVLQNRVSVAQFDDMPNCKQLVDAFVAAHLLVGDKAPDGTPVIALAHEALLREWPPAVQWIESNRENLRLRAGVSAAAALWRTSEQREGRLLTGELLADAGRLLKTAPGMLAPEERLFVNTSLHDDRRRRLKRARRGALAAVAILVAILIPAIGLRELGHAMGVVTRLPRISSNDSTMPVSPATRANLRRSIEDLSRTLRVTLDSHPETGAWTVAQARIALHGQPPFSPDVGRELRAFLTSQRDPGCQCWRETSSKPGNYMATAWVLSALAFYDQPATAEELDTLLALQGPHGSWSIFPAARVDRNASTAVTAHVLIALQRHLDHALIDPDRRLKVSEAIASGVGWLKEIALSGAGRFHPYPPHPVGQFDPNDYQATSAFTIHVLKHVAGSTEHHRAWLDHLPVEMPAILDSESPKAAVVVNDKEGEVDDSRMYRFPWMLVATVEAYGSGSRLQRARALRWVETALAEPLTPAQFEGRIWVMGEVVYALRHVEALLEGRPQAFDRTSTTLRSDRFREPSQTQ